MQIRDSVPRLFKRTVNRLGRPFGVHPFALAFRGPVADAEVPAEHVFDAAWRKNHWGSAQSRSGKGSGVETTRSYRRGLRTLLEARNFRRLFDAPCGDLNWMSVFISESNIDYSGGDVSPLVVQDAMKRHPGMQVRVFDITSDKFPDADVWHCRDCLFHLPFGHVRRTLENFVRSGIPYALLTTNHSWLPHRNIDNELGGFRYLDLEGAPVSLPRAEHYIPDYRWVLDFPTYVGLWSRQSIAEALRVWTSPE